MPDYGQKLRFGTFVTPSFRDADAVVASAVAAEELGYDLVTFQDHPYQPRFLDAWTLLSFVGARTQRVRLSANVHNLPLRPPAVLARSAASLDALTGGRVELALGAGAFWEAIRAMGGPALRPAEAVQALDEAIDVIRGIWDTGGTGPLVAGGELHRVAGAKRGPAPVHPMEIWLGAAKPRMLRMVGRKADGWLPSLGIVGRDAVTQGNAVIDDAAREAGRRPESIRRLLNIGGRFTASAQGLLHGPAATWVEQLTELALEDGVSTFILASDDMGVLERFAGDVMPGVRETVDAHR